MNWLSKGQDQTSNRALLVLAWILAAAAAAALMVRFYDHFQIRYWVFPTYYASAKLIVRGEDFAKFYDDAWFWQQATELAQGEVYSANTPLMGFFFLPLAWLSYDSARLLTSLVDLAALVVATHLMARELRITGAWRAAAFFCVFAAPATLLNLISAQVYPPVLLMLVLAWLAWRRQAEAVAGTLIGIAAAFKTQGLFLVVPMIMERRWRALLAFAGVLAGLVAITFPVVQMDGWAAYLRHASELAAGSTSSAEKYLSVPGLVRNLFVYDEQWNPDPYIDAPLLARSIDVLVLLAFVLLAARVVSVTKDRDITFALFTILSLIFMPLTAPSHLCVAFLPAFIIFSRLEDRLASTAGGWFLLGGILTFAPGVDRLQGLAQFGGPLFFYPRLFGVIILAGLLVRLGLESRAASITLRTSDARQA